MKIATFNINNSFAGCRTFWHGCVQRSLTLSACRS